MKVNCYQMVESSRLERIPVETFLKKRDRGEASLWVDLEILGEEAPDEWLDKLGVEDLARRLCLEARNRPGYYPVRSEIFLALPLTKESDGDDTLESCAFLCRDKLLITLHSQSFLGQEQISKLAASTGWLIQPSVAGLISTLMMEISMHEQSAANLLRRRIAEVDRRMATDPDSIAIEDIREVRSELLGLATLVRDQIPVLRALSGSDRFAPQHRDESEYLNCALVNLQACDSILGWLEGRVKAIFVGYQMHSQKKTNRRLDTLTILSAIFMPITLLAGIWGMNFESMPELSWTHGYAFGLGFMFLVGVVMFLFFRRSGWFS